jgi:vancomycin aglycone glucosyltransferase
LGAEIVFGPEGEFEKQKPTRQAVLQKLPNTRMYFTGKEFYAYLAGPNEISPRIVHSLMASGLTGSLYVRDADPADWGIADVDGISILRSAPNLEQIARQSAIMIHHGGLGMIHAALATGRPQILIPHVFDQMLSADALQDFPFVANNADDLTVHSITTCVTWMLETPDIKAEALAFACSIQERGLHNAREKILAAAMEYLR